jgi:hypothetical protein
MRRWTILLSAALLLGVGSGWAGENEGLRPFLEVRGGEGVLAKNGDVLEVRVGARDLSSVNAVHVDLEYDPAGLSFVEFVPGDLFSDPVQFGPFDRVERRVVDVTTATLGGAVSGEEGTFGLFRFRVLDEERGGVRVVSFQTADGSWEVDTQVSYGNAVGASGVPSRTRLWGNSPNPFNPATEIRWDLAERGAVRLEVYNVSGRLVRTLAKGVWDAGSHTVTWDGRDEEGTEVSSGVYFYRLQAPTYRASNRMILIR